MTGAAKLPWNRKQNQVADTKGQDARPTRRRLTRVSSRRLSTS